MYDDDAAFGFGALGGEESLPPEQTPPGPQAQLMTQLDRDRPGGQAAHAAAEKMWSGFPGLPPALRYPENSVQIFPPRIIAPDPKLYPNITERKHVLKMSSEDSVAIQGQYPFGDHLSVYAISGGAQVHVSQADIPTYGLDTFEIQFLRQTNDSLSTDLAIASAIIGTAERPMPVATPCWAFGANQNIMVQGQTFGYPWKIWIVFHCVEHVPITNLGMTRTALYTADAERLRREHGR